MSHAPSGTVLHTDDLESRILTGIGAPVRCMAMIRYHPGGRPSRFRANLQWQGGGLVSMRLILSDEIFDISE